MIARIWDGAVDRRTNKTPVSRLAQILGCLVTGQPFPQTIL
jgi:hypothetical protein